jgi:hypothetical protein
MGVGIMGLLGQLLFSELLNESAKLVNILHRRLRLKLAVDIDTYELRVVEGLERYDIVGPDATTQQEGCGALIGIEHRPVEMLAAATLARTLIVEDEEVGDTIVCPHLLQVVNVGDAKGLDELHLRRDVGDEGAAEVLYQHRWLRAMELDVVERIVVDVCDDGLRHLIDEESYPLDPLWEDEMPCAVGVDSIGETLRTIVRHDTRLRAYHPHESLAVRPEVEAHHVNVESRHIANILGIAHATNLYEHNRRVIIKFRSQEVLKSRSPVNSRLRILTPTLNQKFRENRRSEGLKFCQYY